MKNLITLTSLICTLLLCGCNEGESITKVKQKGFVYCGQGNPGTFNPQMVNNDLATEVIAPQLFDSLLTIDANTHQVVPHLAKSWHISEDGLQYRFTLRNDIFFHSTDWFIPNRPMNAHDVVFSFMRIIDTQHPYHYINGADYPWFSAISFASNIKTIQAIDDHTVEFVLTSPNHSFLNYLTTIYTVIHSQEYATHLIEINKKADLDNFPVGTGPFMLNEYQHNDLIRLKHHVHYWAGPPKMKQIVFDISSRGTGSLAKTLGHECDVLYSPLLSQIPVLNSEESLRLDIKPAMNIAFIAMQTNTAPLNDSKVRRALSLAINRKSIINSVYYGYGDVAYSMLPRQSWASWQDKTQIRFDPNYAKALLREAGFDKSLELTMWVPTEPRSYNPSPRKVAELIQAHLAQVGVKLNLLFEDKSRRGQHHYGKDYQLVLSGWNADTPDPDSFFRPLLSCDAFYRGVNVSHWCHADFDSMINLARETSHTHHRKNLYTQAQHIINTETPIIPLAHGAKIQVVNHSIKELTFNPFYTFSFENVHREY